MQHGAATMRDGTATIPITSEFNEIFLTCTNQNNNWEI